MLGHRWDRGQRQDCPPWPGSCLAWSGLQPRTSTHCSPGAWSQQDNRQSGRHGSRCADSDAVATEIEPVSSRLLLGPSRVQLPAGVAAQPSEAGRSCQAGISGAESAAVLAVGAPRLRQMIAGLELVQALSPAPDLDGCAITERLLRPRAADRLAVAGDRRHARAGAATAAGAIHDAGPPERQAGRILAVTGRFAPRDRPSLAARLETCPTLTNSSGTTPASPGLAADAVVAAQIL
jgi:hypothetical protein